MTVPQIAEHIGVESLEYLSLEGLLNAIGKGSNRFCAACMTGNYPVDTFMTADKLSLERV
jgi:amidophosphoribosyltransferase